MQSFTLSTLNPLPLVQEKAAQWRDTAGGTARPNLFALAEPEQDPGFWDRLRRLGHAMPLLALSEDKAEAAAPHLVWLGDAKAPSEAVMRLFDGPFPTQTCTLLLSALDAEQLHAHLARFTEVELAGGIRMLLAFWDPAILGTLLGHANDDSLHVPGPVLTPEQSAELMQPITAWWYCDRQARWQGLVPAVGAAKESVEQPWVLTQEQEDMLVESSVPDQVLYHLELNQPNLFDDGKTHAMRYGFVRGVIGSARDLGLSGMRDLVNFTALCLIYRRRIQTDHKILQLLDQVQRKELTLDEAMPLMPE